MTSPLYDVLDHTNHIFSESLSSGDDNDQDQDLQKDKCKDKDIKYIAFPPKFSTEHFPPKLFPQQFSA